MLSDLGRSPRSERHAVVLMHRLALGAFWRVSRTLPSAPRIRSLNAPFGARCLLTGSTPMSPCASQTCLNAPYGAHLGWLLENVACNSASSPSRLEAAPLRCRGFRRSLKFELRELHAKFSDARCFLTPNGTKRYPVRQLVAIHLLVLGAF